MIATCQLCHQVITSTHVPPPTSPGDPASIAIRDYDSLAVEMFNHIVARHPFQVDEMARVQSHAAKMYAMNWADIDTRLESLRREWRSQLIMLMATTTRLESQTAAGGGAASGGRSNGDASNEKNPSRKDSI